MKTEIELVNLLEKYKEELANQRIDYIKLAKYALLDIYTEYDENNPILLKYKYHSFLMMSSDKSTLEKIASGSREPIVTWAYDQIFYINYELDQKTAELVCITDVTLFGKTIYSTKK
jgi:hypothetical protein